MDPKGFNDAQEVGDRLKNGQPVILEPAGRRPRPAAPAHRLRERARVRAERHDVEGRRPGVPAHAVQRRGLRRGEGAPAGARPVSHRSLVKEVLCASLNVYHAHLVRAAPSCRGSRCGRAPVCASFLQRADATHRARARAACGASSRPRACSTSRSSSCSSGSSSLQAHRLLGVASELVRAELVPHGGTPPAEWRVYDARVYGDHTARAPRHRDPLRDPRLQPRRGQRPPRAGRRIDRGRERARHAAAGPADVGAERGRSHPRDRGHPPPHVAARAARRRRGRRRGDRRSRARCSTKPRSRRAAWSPTPRPKPGARARPSAGASKRRSSSSRAAATRCSPTSRR